MKLKNIAIIATLSFGTAAIAQSEQKADLSKRHADQIESMITELELEGEQAEQYRELTTKNRTEMKEMRERVKVIRAEHDTAIKEILTTEQWEAYQVKREAMKARFKGRRHMGSKQETPIEPAKTK